MKHIEWKCTLGYEKCDRCNYDSHSELFICSVCECFEGTLPSHCPGHKVPDDLQDLIYKGKMDFKDGKWIKK